VNVVPTGTVKKLVLEKGFGFIARSNGGDIFFHHSSVADRQFENLAEGQSVEYTLEEPVNAKGPRAASVRPV
jgi:CspA family cold shock protein